MDPLKNDLADTTKPPDISAIRTTRDWKEIDRWLEASGVALTAVYTSALYGNVRCKAAVLEIERILKRK